jgi:hypothetical protein
MIIVQEHDAEGFLDLTAEVEIRHNAPCRSTLVVKTYSCALVPYMHSRCERVLIKAAERYGCILDMA